LNAILIIPALAADFQKLLLKRRALENIVSMAEKTDAAREAVFSYGSECQVSRTWGAAFHTENHPFLEGKD
jgi:hypothetical protein